MPACTTAEHHEHDLYTVVITLDGIEAVYPDEAGCHVGGLVQRLGDAGALLVSITDQHRTTTDIAA